MEDKYQEIVNSVKQHNDLKIYVAERCKREENPLGWCAANGEWAASTMEVLDNGPFHEGVVLCRTNGTVYSRSLAGVWLLEEEDGWRMRKGLLPKESGYRPYEPPNRYRGPSPLLDCFVGGDRGRFRCSGTTTGRFRSDAPNISNTPQQAMPKPKK